MKRIAQIVGGVVVNIAVAGDNDPVPNGWAVCPDTVAIGWVYDGAAFAPMVTETSKG